MSDRLITVVVPCYNVEDFIKPAIESIASQDFRDFEVIFVNDGSEDNTELLIKKNMHLFGTLRTKLINQKNKGVSAARNLGIQYSSGEYLYFFDPDDMMKPNLLKKTAELLKDSDIDCVVFGYEKISTDGRVIGSRFINRSSREFINEYKKDLFYMLEDNEMFNPPWNKLISKKIITDNGIVFPSMKQGEDAVFNTKVFEYAKKILLLEDKLYLYRVGRPGSVESNSSSNNYGEYVKILEAKLSFLEFECSRCEEQYIFMSHIKALFSESYKLYQKGIGFKDFTKIIKSHNLYEGILKNSLKDVQGFNNKLKLFLNKKPHILFCFFCLKDIEKLYKNKNEE
jgi:glycosyltransferase involved in cell wall biosynthesis